MHKVKDPALVRVTELKNYGINLSANEVRALIRAGRLQAIDINPEGQRRSWRIPAAEVKRFREEFYAQAS